MLILNFLNGKGMKRHVAPELVLLVWGEQMLMLFWKKHLKKVKSQKLKVKIHKSVRGIF